MPARLHNGGSVPQPRRGLTVSPSPFNGVKLELALALLVGVVVFVVQEILLPTGWAQVAVLLGYAGAVAVWILWRTRGVLRRASAGPPGPQQ